MELPDDDVPLGFDVKRTKPKKSRDDGISSISETNKYRTKYSIKVSKSSSLDKEIPSPVISFDNIVSSFPHFNRQLLANVKELGFTSPTPVQSQAIPILLQHRNLLACAPTGSGKTAAYLLPLLQHYFEDCIDPSTKMAPEQSITSENLHKIRLFGVILVPTQELVKQIWSEAIRLSRGITEEHFISSLTRRHYADRGKVRTKANDQKTSSNRNQRELRLPRSTRILVATPYRMSFLLSLDSSVCPFDISGLTWLILDEYDKMLEVDVTNSTSLNAPKKRRTRSFRDQINPIFHKLAQSKSIETQLKVALFSATIPDEVVHWANSELPTLLCPSDCLAKTSPQYGLVQLCIGTRNAAVSTVKQELRYCATEEGKLLEMRYLLVRGLLYPCLIFMESRERAKELVKEILLSDTNILANVISSDKTDAQRSAIVRAFRKGQLNVLVCTDLLGRGIDFKGVNMVVNYDVPPSKEEYIHRVGRTGRAGHHGRAITLWTDADLPQLGEILKVMKRSGSKVDPELERLVEEWHTRRAQLVLAKRKRASSDGELAHRVIVSKRRGERRLVHDLVRKDRRENAETEESSESGFKKIKWFRRWNPHRKRISELSGARQNKQQQG